MTEPPTPNEGDPHGAPEPQSKKGRGCFYGGLATVGIFVGSTVVAGVLLASLGDSSGALGGIVGLLPIALLVAAGIYWRKTPGFLLGIGLTIGISLAVGTACVALFVSAA